MKLHYRVTGSGEVLVILHGLFGMSDNWQTMAKYYAEKYKVVLVDMRNHGHSPHDLQMSYELMCEDIRELFEDININKAILLGHSMGGKAAMFFAQKYPHFLSKLIVADMGIKKYPPHHQLIFEALFAVDLNKIESRKEAEEILKQYITDFSVLQFLLKNLYWSDKGKLAWRFNLQVLFDNIENILIEIPAKVCDINTLFVRGGKSNYILETDAEAIKAIFPRSVIQTIPHAGHWVHAEAPKEFYDITTEFMSSK
jgi:pimeloyl-ACP methyl ester carboxylesterase